MCYMFIVVFPLSGIFYSDLQFSFRERKKKKKSPCAKHVLFCLPYQAYISRKHQDDKVFVFERGPVTFVFNFHTSKSFVDYKIGIQVPGKYPSYNAIVLR